MMEITQGKIILVNGCSFTGKTQLISILTSTFEHARVVSFELIYEKGKSLSGLYKNFYDKINELKKTEKLIIAESVGNYASSYLQQDSYLNIVVDPGLEKHRQNMERFERTFGKRLLSIRAGSLNIESMRKRLVLPNKYLLYNWNNLEQIMEAINTYVDT